MAKVTKQEEIISVTLELTKDEAEIIAGVMGCMISDTGYDIYRALYNARIQDDKYTVKFTEYNAPLIEKV